MKKYGINSSDCKNKLRIIIVINTSRDTSSREVNQLKRQLEMSESHKDCSLDIHTESFPNSEELTRIFQADENYKNYTHTLIMIDEIWR